MKTLPIWFTAPSISAAFADFKRVQFPEGLSKEITASIKNTFYLGAMHGIIRAHMRGDIPPENLPHLDKMQREIERFFSRQKDPYWIQRAKNAKAQKPTK